MNPPNAISSPAAPLHRYAQLAVLTALATMALKTVAWWLTDSVGLLSDALESGVNLAGALAAWWLLRLAAQPPDADHAYGHGKAEYFSSAFEGGLILLAAAGIAVTAVQRLLAPQALAGLDVGLAVSLLASLLNLATANVLRRAGKRQHSIALEASGQHLLTDVWTSVGVLLGLGAAWLTDWWWLDPLLALAVAGHIVFTAVDLLRRSAAGLMDAALPASSLAPLQPVLARYRAQGIDFHALRSRQSGRRHFVSLHVLVPPQWTVRQGHDLLEALEADLRAVLPNAVVFTHLEPLNDPAADRDIELDR
jgi:cation diffusion facilitator family transporter